MVQRRRRGDHRSVDRCRQGHQQDLEVARQPARQFGERAQRRTEVAAGAQPGGLHARLELDDIGEPLSVAYHLQQARLLRAPRGQIHPQHAQLTRDQRAPDRVRPGDRAPGVAPSRGHGEQQGLSRLANLLDRCGQGAGGHDARVAWEHGDQLPTGGCHMPWSTHDQVRGVAGDGCSEPEEQRGHTDGGADAKRGGDGGGEDQGCHSPDRDHTEHHQREQPPLAPDDVEALDQPQRWVGGPCASGRSGGSHLPPTLPPRPPRPV